MRKNNLRKRSGATLLELILAVGLMAMIAVAVYGMLAQGIRAYRALIAPLPGQEAVIFMQRFERDLANCLRYQGQGLRGNAEKLQVATALADDPAQPPSIGMVSYAFDAGKHRMTRVASLGPALYSHERSPVSLSLSHVQRVSLSYYALDPVKNEWVWKNEWPGTPELPRCVQLDVTIQTEAGWYVLRKSVRIPIAS